MISVEWLVRKGLFRNPNHAIWFLMSTWLLVLTLAYYLYPGQKIIILLPVLVHLITFIHAIIATRSEQKSDILSRDCIWFNGVLLIFYISFLYFLNNE